MLRNIDTALLLNLNGLSFTTYVVRFPLFVVGRKQAETDGNYTYYAWKYYKTNR
jgi:hypothetical protein